MKLSGKLVRWSKSEDVFLSKHQNRSVVNLDAIHGSSPIDWRRMSTHTSYFNDISTARTNWTIKCLTLFFSKSSLIGRSGVSCQCTLPRSWLDSCWFCMVRGVSCMRCKRRSSRNPSIQHRRSISNQVSVLVSWWRSTGANYGTYSSCSNSTRCDPTMSGIRPR